jgi:rubredoxin
LEAVIVPLKVQYKSTLPLTNPKAVVNQKYKAVLLARGFYPFFLMSDRATETKALDRHECRACGYVYDPKKGDPKIDIAPGTAFEDLPQTWVCPVCAARKSAFQNLGQMEGVSGFKANQRYGVGVNGMTEGQKSLLIFGGLVVGFLLLLSMYGLQ